MRTELQKQITDKFPQIFPPEDLAGEVEVTLLPFGLAVGDGWYDLIYKLCEDIMATSPPPEFKAFQVKEKYGGLSFYVTDGTVEINKLIEEAGEESYKICENCGTRKNVTVEGSWVRTLCKTCRNGT